MDSCYAIRFLSYLNSIDEEPFWDRFPFRVIRSLFGKFDRVIMIVGELSRKYFVIRKSHPRRRLISITDPCIMFTKAILNELKPVGSTLLEP